MVQFERHLAGVWRRRKLEVDGRAVDVVNDDFIHLFKEFHATLHLLGLGRLVAETLDERLDVLDFALLVFVSRALHVHTFLAQTDVIGIRHFIIVNLAVRDFHRADGDVVQKSAVVRNHQYRAVIGLQEAFQPLNGLNVKVIGRLV